MGITIIVILCIVIAFVAFFIYQYNEEKQRLLEEYLSKNRKRLDAQLRQEQDGLQSENLRLSQEVETALANLENLTAQAKKEKTRIEELKNNSFLLGEELRKRKEEQNNFLTDCRLEKKESIQKELELYRLTELQKIEQEVVQNKKWASETLEQYWDELSCQTEKATKTLSEIELALTAEKEKQQAINEAIARQRELEEQKDFYRIKLTDDAKQDIKYLVSIIDNIKHSTLLYKLIWSEYIQKPFNTMIKNVTGGKEIRCVIYKITNINTQEVYIGKTKADVAKRWTEHVKTSLNIGTVAKSKIHNALFKHWDEFTFEVLEVVDDETKLSQREKYYINFYQSNIYGYNMNSGG